MVTVFENPKKVSFNIASEASYVYILCKIGPIWRVFAEVCGQTVLPDRSIVTIQKLVRNAEIQIRHFWVIFKQCDWLRDFLIGTADHLSSPFNDEFF